MVTILLAGGQEVLICLIHIGPGVARLRVPAVVSQTYDRLRMGSKLGGFNLAATATAAAAP